MLKLSGEVLEGKNTSGIDFKIVQSISEDLRKVIKLGVQVAVVIGGGNFWRYRDFKESGLDRVQSDYMGMIATVINSIALMNGVKHAGMSARVLSALPMAAVVEPFIRENALKYLDAGEVVICAGGTGNPFFTTDTAAALRELELKCDVLLKATKVDYVYDKDPVKYKNARFYTQMGYTEVLEKKLEVMDLSAISLCAGEKLPVIVFNQKKQGNLLKVVKNGKIGTLIS